MFTLFGIEFGLKEILIAYIAICLFVLFITLLITFIHNYNSVNYEMAKLKEELETKKYIESYEDEYQRRYIKHLRKGRRG